MFPAARSSSRIQTETGDIFIIVERKAPHERFGSRSIAAEVNQLLGDRPRRRVVNLRQVSVSLRWLAKKGRIFRFDPGRPHKEAQYVRERPEDATQG